MRRLISCSVIDVCALTYCTSSPRIASHGVCVTTQTVRSSSGPPSQLPFTDFRRRRRRVFPATDFRCSTPPPRWSMAGWLRDTDRQRLTRRKLHYTKTRGFSSSSSSSSLVRPSFALITVNVGHYRARMHPQQLPPSIPPPGHLPPRSTIADICSRI